MGFSSFHSSAVAKRVRRGLPPALLASFLSVGLPPTGAHAAAGPFVGLDGLWAGTGTVKLKDGTKERMRCRGQYLVREEGNNLQQTLRCSSDSYKFHVNAFVNSKGGTLTGNWSEVTRNVSGRIAGRAEAGRIQVKVTGGAFSATMSLVTKANQQSVVIKPTGTDVVDVTVTMGRAR